MCVLDLVVFLFALVESESLCLCVVFVLCFLGVCCCFLVGCWEVV